MVVETKTSGMKIYKISNFKFKMKYCIIVKIQHQQQKHQKKNLDAKYIKFKNKQRRTAKYILKL